MKTKLLDLMRRYRRYHTKPWTVWTHFVGIPCVTLSMLILLSWVVISIPGVFTLSIAWIGVLVLAVYYLLLDFFIGAVTTILLILLCILASMFTMHGPSTLALNYS
jgi:uncharacterized membrane protein YGL010W